MAVCIVCDHSDRGGVGSTGSTRHQIERLSGRVVLSVVGGVLSGDALRSIVEPPESASQTAPNLLFAVEFVITARTLLLFLFLLLASNLRGCDESYYESRGPGGVA